MSRAQTAMLAFALVASLLALALPRGVAAQRLSTELLPTAGTRVRVVTLSGDRRVGSLGTVVRDTMMLTVMDRRGGRRTQYPVSLDHVRELWVSQGRRRGRGALYGFGIGLFGGAAVGAAAGATIGTIDSRGSQCTDCAEAFFGAIGGGVLGAILGATLGTVLGAKRGPERWERDGRRLPETADVGDMPSEEVRL